jgi:hypothetical protein
MQAEKLIIQRNKRWSDSKYSVGIYIDDEFIVNTIESDRQEILLSPGKYRLKVEQAHRSGETEIEIKKGKTSSITFSSSAIRNYIYLSSLAGVLGASLLDTNGPEELLFFLPFVLLLIYSVTQGRKNYFVFGEAQEEHSWLLQ